MTHEERARVVLHEAESDLKERAVAHKRPLHQVIEDLGKQIMRRMNSAFRDVEKDALERAMLATCPLCREEGWLPGQDAETGLFVHIKSASPDIAGCLSSEIRKMIENLKP